MGSASELEYHLLLAYDLDVLDDNLCACLMREVVDVKRMLTALIQKLKVES